MFMVFNNAGEYIASFTKLPDAKSFADNEAKELYGARHYVWQVDLACTVYETKPAR